MKFQLQAAVDIAKKIDVHHFIKNLSIFQTQKLKMCVDSSVQNQQIYLSIFFNRLIHQFPFLKFYDKVILVIYKNIPYLQSLARLTSHFTNAHYEPLCSQISATSLNFYVLLAPSMRRHFRLEYCKASSFPMPELAPVITMTELAIGGRLGDM